MSTTRHEYDRLASLYLPIAAAVFAVIALTLFWFLLRYRAGRQAASATTDAPRVESAYAIALALITAFLLTMTFRAESRSDAVTAADAPATRIDVTAAQWTWRFTYRPGVALVSTARRHATFPVPAGRRVLISAHSDDVLHDFWIPDLRFQRQVWPDHVERFTLVFGHPGTYQGLCAWFCGLDHDRMDFTVRALPPAQFDAWLARR